MKDIKRRDFIKMSNGAGLETLVIPAALIFLSSQHKIRFSVLHLSIELI